MARPPKSLLKDSHPELASEVFDKSLLPTLATGADKSIEWQGSCGHRWFAKPYNRTNAKNPTGCPVCRGKQVLAGFNDVATTHPDVARLFANPEDAKKYTAYSNKTVSLICANGHNWQAPIDRLTMQGSGCPYCSGRNAVEGETDIKTTHPDIARELYDSSLSKVLSAGSNKRVKWVCSNDSTHIWDATVYARAIKGTGCPYCSGKHRQIGVNDFATTHKKGHKQRISAYHRTECLVCDHIDTSTAEKELQDIVKQMVGEDNVICNDKTILGNGQELDIVISSMKLAIEYNGNRWHSDLYKLEKEYHLRKQQLCAMKGYRLIFIWEDDFLYKKDIIVKMLAYKLQNMAAIENLVSNYDPKMTSTVYARKLSVSRCYGAEATAFLEENHIQGGVSASFHFALRDDDNDIRALLSIRSPKNGSRMSRKAGEWEIQRYATKGHVPGGFTKLLKFAESTLLQSDLCLTKWISFSANDVSDGNLYKECGFFIDNILKPDYKVVGDYTKWIRVPKESFQKKRFRNDSSLLWDESWSEREALQQNKLYKIFDAGKIRWVKYVIFDFNKEE